MKILAFAASTSRKSINKQLLTYASQMLEQQPDVQVELIDLNDYEMPIFSVDREAEGGVPQLAKDFYAKIGEADGLLISFAEHNGHYAAAFKNLFDWTSRIDKAIYQGKPSVLMAASMGPGGGRSVLGAAVTSGPFFGNDIRASLSFPSFGANFDTESGTVSDPDLDAQLREALATLIPAPELASS